MKGRFVAACGRRRISGALRLLLTACFCAGFHPLTVAAMAQGIPVYSGEHDGFTRIVVDFSRPTDWSVTREPQGYRVTFDPAPQRLDLSRVFDLIPRDRLENITQSPRDGSLILYSSCDCDLEAFDAGSDAVALDIRDSPERGGENRPSVLPPGLTVRTTAELRPVLPPESQALQVVAETSRSERTNGSAAPAPAGEAPAPSRPRQREAAAQEAAPGPPVLPGSMSERLQARSLALALAADLERAARAGLVDMPNADRAEPERSPPGAPDAGGAAGSPTRPARGSDGRENVRLRSAHDIWSEAARRAGGREARCVSQRAFEFMAVAEPRRLMARLPKLRADLVDARGAVSEAGARALAEAYLALGFGAEAALVLRDAGLPALWASRYRSLARIVDHGGDSDEAAWAGAAGCQSAIALWAVLGQAPGLPGDAVDTAAVQAAFFELPAHLRIHLGDDLAARLRAAGHGAAADAVAANAEMLRLPSADIADAGADRAGAPPGRDGAAGPAIAPGAQEMQVRELLDRIADALAAGITPDDGDLDLAEALFIEYEGTAEGRRLAGALAIRQMRNGDVESALQGLSLVRTDPDPAWPDAVQRGLATALIDRSPAGLLEATLHPRADEALDLLSEVDGTRAAERLIEAGFPEAAARVLRVTGADNAPDSSVVTARAALEAGDAARALALVAGRTDADAGRLRARALAALGNHRAAAEAFAAAGDGANAARSAWLSGDPGLVEAFGTPDQRRAMTGLGRLEDTAPGVDGEAAPLEAEGGDDPDRPQTGLPPAPEEGSLAAAAALLERSAERRSALLEIVGATR